MSRQSTRALLTSPPSQALNILRIGGRLKVTDFDSSKPISTPDRVSFLGDKFSSAVLGPEMFYELQNKEELRMFEDYWREDKDADTPLWRKIAPKGGFVVRTFRVVQETGAPDLSRPLPYDLITSSVAMDLWSLGVLMYLLITGEALVPSNRDDDCVNAEAMTTLCHWDDKTARERLGKVDDIGARDLLSHLLVASPAQRLAYSLDRLLGHVFFDADYLENIEKKRALEKANLLALIDARPPEPFQEQDFQRLWDAYPDMREELAAGIFRMMEEHTLTRPCETAEIDAKAKHWQESRNWETKTMHDKKRFLELFVFPLSFWKELTEVTLPADAAPGTKCSVSSGDYQIEFKVPDDVEGGSIVRQAARFLQLQALARKKNATVLGAMLNHRDDVITHPDGQEFAAVKALGKVEQP